MDFLIISNLSQIILVISLLNIDKLRAQHKIATCLLYINVLLFYAAPFIGRF